MTARISALSIYPVKGCRGIALDRARVTLTGFEHDRKWLIVRPDGRFVTQREEPRLALIEIALLGESLQLLTPGGDGGGVPLAATGPQIEVTCWNNRCAAFDMGDPAARLLTGYLGKPLRLVRFDARRPRVSSPAWTQGIELFQ